MHVLYDFFAVLLTWCNQLDSNLAILEGTVKMRKILEFLPLTAQW